VIIRSIDVIGAIIGLLLASPVLIVIFFAGLLDTGSPIFIQQRVGRNKKPFKLIKFRTMSIHTQSVATHLVDSNSVTKLGSFLRKSKLDELPQLFNVLIGDMSFVGPRPCLYSQPDLIHEREKRKVFQVRPGVTGLAQINNIDMSTPQLLAEWDEQMISHYDISTYFKLIMRTLLGAGSGDRVR